MLVSETELSWISMVLMRRVRDHPQQGIRWNNVSVWDWKGGGVVAAVVRVWLQETDQQVNMLRITESVFSLSKKSISNMEKEKTRVKHVTLGWNLKYW